MRRQSLLIPVALLVIAALSGCVSSTPASPSAPTSATPLKTLTTVPTVPASPAPAEQVVDVASTADVLVKMYDLGGYASTKDSEYAYPGMTTDAFPRGTHVAAVRLSVSGFVSFGKADLTGLTLTDSYWEGTPNKAVLDQNEGPAFAKKAGIPWGAAEAFGPTPWTVENNKPYNVVAAFYTPPGATALKVIVNVPSQKAPMTLTLPVHGE